MTISASKIFSPAPTGALKLQHRIVMAPLTRMRASLKTAVPAAFAAEYYAQRATPGGLLISEGTFIAEEAGGYDYVPGIYSPEQISAWKKVTDAVHKKGGLIVCQLWALGRVADANVVPVVWGAGSKPDVPEEDDGMRGDVYTPLVDITMMQENDIERFIGYYRQAALNAMEAGFDGVEIHGANGYLIDQFLQSNSNDRTDSYGGSLKNRFRFPLAVLNAVCNVISPGRVGIRMSPFSRFQGMREADPLGLFVPWAEAIIGAQPGLAYVHAVEGRAVGGRDTPRHLWKVEDTLAPIREVVQRATVRFVVAGGFTPETAIKQCATSDDLVAFGRYFISNPDLPARIQHDWPLTNYNRATFYTQFEEGYTDFLVFN